MLERIKEFVQTFILGFYEVAPVYVCVETEIYDNY